MPQPGTNQPRPADAAAERPIVVLGFGRSGTTWLADIISKVTGGLCLFEPLHPSVLDNSRQVAYALAPIGTAGEALRDHLQAVLAGRHRRPWLLRNHVPFALEDMSPEGLELIWNECPIVGFKSIRAHFLLPWLRRELDARIVVIVRHPAAVVASILNRKNFWEFGWPGTYDLILDNTMRALDPQRFPELAGSALHRHAAAATSDVDRIAILWSLAYGRLLADAHQFGATVLLYEDLYREPFPTVRRVFRDLELPQPRIHPAHVFTPAMTSLKTVHGLAGFDPSRATPRFWSSTLNAEDVRQILGIAADAGLDLYAEDGSLRPQGVALSRARPASP